MPNQTPDLLVTETEDRVEFKVDKIVVTKGFDEYDRIIAESDPCDRFCIIELHNFDIEHMIIGDVLYIPVSVVPQ